jgi:hypothetical protein
VKHLDQAPPRQPTLAAQPQPRQGGVLAAGPNAQVAVECDGRPSAERQRTLPAALAEHEQHVQVEVHVADLETYQLGAARSHVDQQQDQGSVGALLECLAGAGRQQPPQAILWHHRDGLLRHDGRLHPHHRVGGDLVLLLEPAV